MFMRMSRKAECAVEAPSGNSGIDFVEVAMAHMSWRSRLQSHISGEATENWLPSAAGVDDSCGLGRWLSGNGRDKFGHFSAFRRLEAEHAEFHYFAGVVLARVLEGYRAEAETVLKNEFSQATRRILIAINEMNETMRQTAA
jgi:hypothetical protein